MHYAYIVHSFQCTGTYQCGSYRALGKILFVGPQFSCCKWMSAYYVENSYRVFLEMLTGGIVDDSNPSPLPPNPFSFIGRHGEVCCTTFAVPLLPPPSKDTIPL